MSEKLTKKVADKFLKKTASAFDDNPVGIAARMVDLSLLLLAYDAHKQWLEASGKKTEENESQAKAIALLRRHVDAINLGFQTTFGPVTERPDAAAVRMVLTRAMEQNSLTPTAVARWTDALQVSLPWLKSRTSIFNSMFTGKVARAARELASVVEEENPASRLNKISSIAPVSGLMTHRRLIESMAEEAGAPLSMTESVLTDAETGSNLGDDLQQVKAKLDVVTPNTPEAADLQARKIELVQAIEAVANDSSAPSAVLSSAATASSTPRRSTVAERFRLTPEQAEVSETMGKVVVAAGAGSGKTTTLVATIVNLIENKGYAPEQILTCSFTRAASAELGAKLERDGKVGGVVTGTTHRVARDIIQRNRPDLSNAMRNTKGADKCFKIAIKQVEMDVAGYQAQVEAQKAVLQRIEAIPGWRNIDILRSFHEQASKGRALSEKQLAVIPKFEGRGGGGYGGSQYGRSYYRRYATNDDWLRMANVEDDEASIGGPAPADPKGMSKYWTAPVGQWFNIGQPLTNAEGKKMGDKQALLAVDNFKNSGLSVEAARQQFGDQPIVALYGAYEWLKKNDPVHGPAMDYTDQLEVALKILEQDPKALAAEQARYKVVMVDEAQDLNDVQFKMFNLIGQKSDLLSFIGDDKQSIYGFRGAKPDNYVNLSRQEGYQTKLMTMNFRSGSEIVDAANRLIAHNEDRQIPMVCKSHDSRGVGSVSALRPDTHEDAANLVAQQIKDGIDAGESPADFGILVRNNAELDAYMLALIVRGIPYRSLKAGQGGYFAKPVVRALTSWIRLAIGGSTEKMNEAVTDAHRTPGFGMDEMFAANLGKMAKGQNYYDYIASGGTVYFDRSAWMNKKVADYVDVIRTIKATGGGTSAGLIRAILDIKGAKQTFIEALMKQVDEDDLAEEGGEGGEDALREAALAPVRPLMIMAENFQDPENMLAFIQKMKDANDKVQKKSPQDKDDWKEPAVLCGTTHGWKGLEAKHVYASMAGGTFPSHRNDKVAEEQEMAGVPVTAYDEERRLAYVAITRGRDTTTVVCPMKNYLGKPGGVSRFVDEACIPLVGAAGDKEPDIAPQDRMASTKRRAGKFADDLISCMTAEDDVLITEQLY